VTSSGGAIPGVTVKVKSLETGAERTLLTDEAGGYDAVSLPVGRYQVRAEKTAFAERRKPVFSCTRPAGNRGPATASGRCTADCAGGIFPDDRRDYHRRCFRLVGEQQVKGLL